MQITNLSLKEARMLRNKTQEDMGKLLGVSSRTYITIENNPGRTTIDQAKKIAEYLNIDIKDFNFF